MSLDLNPFRFDELVDPAIDRDAKTPLRIWPALVAAILSMIACGFINTIVSLPIAILASEMFDEQLGFGQLGMLIFVFVPTGFIIGILSICLLLRNTRGLIVFGVLACAVPFAVPSVRAVVCSRWSLVFASVVLVLIDLCLSVIIWRVSMINSSERRNSEHSSE